MPSNDESNGSTPDQPIPSPQPAWRLPAWRHPIEHGELRQAIVHLVVGFVASPAFDTLVADADTDAATNAMHRLLAALYPAGNPDVEG